MLEDSRPPVRCASAVASQLSSPGFDQLSFYLAADPPRVHLIGRHLLIANANALLLSMKLKVGPVVDDIAPSEQSIACSLPITGSLLHSKWLKSSQILT